jgi:hypothetical protein
MRRKIICAIVLSILFCWNLKAEKKYQRYVVKVTATDVDITKPIAVLCTGNRIQALIVALDPVVWTEEEWKDCERRKICPHVTFPTEADIDRDEK